MSRKPEIGPNQQVPSESIGSPFQKYKHKAYLAPEKLSFPLG